MLVSLGWGALGYDSISFNSFNDLWTRALPGS
jgi:hypothetical protein